MRLTRFFTHVSPHGACSDQGRPPLPSLLQRKDGVTVVEIIVTLGIMSVFCTALYGFYWLHLKVLKTEEVRLNLRDSSRLAVDFIVRELHMAGARPIRGGPCEGFERLTEAEDQRITLQYDFHGDASSAPPDSCPDDASERITYWYDAGAQLLRRATSGGAPQPFINDVPSNGFLVSYFDRNGDELSPPLATPEERAEVHSVRIMVRTRKAHPDPTQTNPLESEFSSTVFLVSPAR